MHREIRRKDRQITEEEARAILEKGEVGFLATVNEDGGPYVIPISYAVEGDEIFIHCAKQGQKLENFQREPRVCFSVAYAGEPVYENSYSTYYESAVVYGRIFPIEKSRKEYALYKLVEKYFPNYKELEKQKDEAMIKATDVYAISIEHITGKAKR